MLKLMKQRQDTGEPLTIVSDQIGTPTSCWSLAQAIFKLLEHKITDFKILHWTDQGVASWYDFAVAIAEIALELELIQNLPKIIPITSDQFPTAAKRPSMSVSKCVFSWGKKTEGSVSR